MTGTLVATCRGTLVADLMVHRPKTVDVRSTLSDARALFANDHVHMALVVTDDRRLVTTVERSDLPRLAAPSTPLCSIGGLEGRTVTPDLPMVDAVELLHRTGRRRLAVVDHRGQLVGLLCLKRNGTGFCSDRGIASRAASRASRVRTGPSAVSGGGPPAAS